MCAGVGGGDLWPGETKNPLAHLFHVKHEVTPADASRRAVAVVTSSPKAISKPISPDYVNLIGWSCGVDSFQSVKSHR